MMTNPNQQLLDYAVENIKEWHDSYNYLRSDKTSQPLFYTQHNKGGKACDWNWSRDEWLAEIRRGQEIKMNKPLERNTEYDVKLTGEEIALMAFLLSHCNSSLLTEAYNKFNDFLSEDLVEIQSPPLPTVKLFQQKDEILDWLGRVFILPETEEQRHLRELREQYQALGDKLKQMDK
jgi:hypothetical protein